MSANSEKLLLLDAPSLYFRAFFGVPDTFRAPDGTPTNAVRGLMDFMARLITQYRPQRLVACMDADWRPAFRSAALPSYKAHRLGPDGKAEIVPADLQTQIPWIEEMLEALGIAHVGVPGFEADDVIGTLAYQADIPTDVVTGDRDLFQVVDDSRQIRVLYIAKGVGRHEIVDEAWVSKKYQIPGRGYADFATLRGDASDGLPGVAGIGEKTAAWLVTRYESLEAILEALEDPSSDLPQGPRRKLAAARDYLAVAPDVVYVRKDVQPKPYDDVLPSSPDNPEAFVDLADRLDLGSSAERILKALAIGQNAP